jgi:hypothetical protein
MKNFLADLWNDLRAKRLWPLAVVLLAGLVAVPVVLSQSAQEPPKRPPAGSQSAKSSSSEDDGPAGLPRPLKARRSTGSTRVTPSVRPPRC